MRETGYDEGTPHWDQNNQGKKKVRKASTTAPLKKRLPELLKWTISLKGKSEELNTVCATL